MNLTEEQFLNPVAELNEPDSGSMIKPAQAKSGDTLFCPDSLCKDNERILILKHSKLGNPFFSHRPGFSHPIYPQTLLHKMAVKWFEGKTEFEIPAGTSLNKTFKTEIWKLDPAQTQLEFRLYQSVIPDVVAQTTSGFKFAIEIVVTNDVSSEKSLLLKEHSLPTVSIDLTDFYNANKESCRTDIDFVNANLDSLLKNLGRKRWIRLPTIDDKSSGIEWKDKEVMSADGCLLSIALITSFISVVIIMFF